MADEHHFEILRRGRDAWNHWRRQNPSIQPDLRNADLTPYDLRDYDLRSTDLRGADLRGTGVRFGKELRRAKVAGAMIHEHGVKIISQRGKLAVMLEIQLPDDAQSDYAIADGIAELFEALDDIHRSTGGAGLQLIEGEPLVGAAVDLPVGAAQ